MNAPSNPLQCPNCGKGPMVIKPQDAEKGDLDQVTCNACGWKTDYYEAWKAGNPE